MPSSLRGGTVVSYRSIARTHTLKISRSTIFCLITLLLSAVLFLPYLGFSGLSLSEGHRAIPGWEMLTRGEAFPTTLFGYPYVRKPPGVPWAIAIVSHFFGPTEFAARLVSVFATAFGAVLSGWAASRWFGERAALVAGAGYLLMPVFWYAARSAEIEALHNTMTLTASIGVIAIVRHAAMPVPRRSGKIYDFLISILMGVALAAMIGTKGPAGLPVVIGVGVCAVLILGHQRSMSFGPWHSGGPPSAVNSRVLIALVPGVMLCAAFTAWAAWRTMGSLEGLPSPVIEPPSHFLWNASHIGQIMLLPLAAMVSGLPMSIGYVMFWRLPPLRDSISDATARSLAWGMLVAVAIYTLAGIANDRYAMPALTLCPLVVGAAFTRATEGLGSRVQMGRQWNHHLTVWSRVLIVAAYVHHAQLEYRREYRTGGRAEGTRLATLLPDGAIIHAFEMIDQRPEVCWYLQSAARRLGKNIECKWVPYPAVFGHQGSPILPAVGGYVLMRTDTRPRDQYPPEHDEYAKYNLFSRLEQLDQGKVHNFEFTLYRVLP